MSNVSKIEKLKSLTKRNIIKSRDLSEINNSSWKQAKPYSEIPGPKPLPFVGNTWRFIPFIGDYKIRSIDQLTLKLYKKYGPIVKIEGLLGRPDMVFLYDADEIEKVFRNEELMPYRPSMPSLNYYKHVLRKDFFGNSAGVIAVHGKDWYDFRTRVQKPMLQPQTAKLYAKTIEETADVFVEKSKRLRNNLSEVPFNYLNEIHKWSLESLAKIALDVNLGCLDEPPNPETQILINAVVSFFEKVPILELKVPFWRVFNTPTWKQYIHSLDTITNIAMKHINAAIENLNDKNINNIDNNASLLQRILAMNNDPKIASILALDMFLVGIDTTSSAVASIMYQLAKHPKVQENLYKEVKTVLPSENDKLTVQKLENMIYLKSVIKETLRMYPVVIGNGRCMTRNNVISGYQIPEGVQVVFQHYAISNSEKYFKRSSEFLPERWLKNTTNEEKQDFVKSFNNENTNAPCEFDKNSVHPFASLPFGYGRRMCLGRRFAELEIQTVIAKMIKSFKIEYHYGDLKYHIDTMYIPNGPLKFKLIDR
ncbi:cytochrome P450, putative [Pediculus humanus corporis]|uniref:Cytochrome P450, putative n=1 Tax=Pediculus humanus subsp. corporis TaxID=121224 RepID=E0W2B1_PEDHC|nr:cytochrome P450, putative [Pediculus humanus corporis]EEB19767.1 cytochrome P450, putative [Pediculus humanus corporis]